MTSPAGIVGAGSGYPDADPRPSMTIDLRSTYTLSPTGGAINFVIAPTYNAALSLVAGTIAQTGYKVFTGTSSAASDGWASVTNVAATRGFIPMASHLDVETLFGNDGNSIYFSAFRPIAIAADVSYTGSTMMDNGSVIIQKQPVAETLTDTRSITYSTSSSQTVFENTSINVIGSALTLMPNAVIQPARKNWSANIIPTQPEYLAIQPRVTDYTSNFSAANTASTGVVPAPVVYPANAISVQYSGLDASASITVTVRYCVQLAVNPYGATLYASAAKPSPSAEPGLLRRFAEWAGNQPVVRSAGLALGNIAYSYVARKAAPMLALMNH